MRRARGNGQGRVSASRWCVLALFGAVAVAAALALAGCDVPTRIEVVSCVDLDSIVPDTLGAVRFYKTPCP